MLFSLLACGIAGFAFVLLALAGPAYRIGLLSLSNAFTLLQWGGYVGVGAAATGALAAVLAYRRGAKLRLAAGLIGMAAGLSAFAVPFEWQRRDRAAPPIHDITTDLENPPAFRAVVPLRRDAPNSLERPPDLGELQRQAYPDLGPITVPMPLDQAFNRALAVAQESGWTIVTADSASGHIEATDTSRWFGFEDDIVIRLTPWGAGTRVDVR
ncbi:MAG: hypothetical protein A3F70_08140, partial [Acidobacteria bacterium RIFCSPLOWO2_12_FULL_67_14]